MASTGRPRAGGSGIKDEGKFRQRVDDHYRVIASAKSTIKVASPIHNFCALSLCVVAGISLYLWMTETAPRPDDALSESIFFDAAGLLSITSTVVLLVSARCGTQSRLAAGAKDAEKHGAEYGSRLFMLVCVLLVALCVEAVGPAPPLPLLYAFYGLSALDLVGALVGLRGSSTLKRGFEMQKAKSKAK